MPRSRRRTIAASMSPFVSWRARLQSIIPAPVRSRSSLTSAAEISAIRLLLRPRDGRVRLRRALGLRILAGRHRDGLADLVRPLDLDTRLRDLDLDLDLGLSRGR